MCGITGYYSTNNVFSETELYRIGICNLPTGRQVVQ